MTFSPSNTYMIFCSVLNYENIPSTLTSFLFLSCVALAKKPNFVYIMVDDAGYGDFSCFGQKKFKTPNVDRMAKEGMTHHSIPPARFVHLPDPV